MTTSQIPFEPGAFTTPVVDYEPPPFAVAAGLAPQLDVAAGRAPHLNVAGPAAPHLDVAGPAAPCPTPTPAALHRPPRRPLRAAERAEPTPPPAAASFADATLRRVLEVIDRRRPIAQLRPMLTPALLDMVFTMARGAGPDKAAVLRRVRLRTADVDAAEVFATYTRGRRVRAIAGRIEVREGHWRMVALQVG